MSRNNPIEQQEAEREQAAEQQRQQRRFFLHDHMDPKLTRAQKESIRNRQIMELHAETMFREGRLKDHELNRLRAGQLDEGLGDISTEDYIKLRGMAKNQFGNTVEVGPSDIDTIRNFAHRESAGEGVEETAARYKDIHDRVSRDILHRMHDASAITDEKYAQMLAHNKLLPPALLDHNNELIANAGTIAGEMYLEAKYPDTKYKAGDLIEEKRQKAEAKAIKDDPQAKAKAEMRVTDKEAAEWRRKDEEVASAKHKPDAKNSSRLAQKRRPMTRRPN